MFRNGQRFKQKIINLYLASIPENLKPKARWKIKVLEEGGAQHLIVEGLKKGYITKGDLPLHTELSEPLEVMLFRRLPAKAQFEILKECPDKEAFLRAASKPAKMRLLKWLAG